MPKIKYYTIILLFLACCPYLFSQLTVTGGIGKPPYKYETNLSGTGIKAIYFLNSFSNAQIEYSSNAAFVRFFKYTNSLSDAQAIPSSEINSSTDGKTTKYIISKLEDSRGYYAEINGSVTAAIWIIDYTQHLSIINSITPHESEDKCEYLKLLIDKKDELYFYTNSGGRKQINRYYTIKYNNLEWNDDSETFIEIEQNIDNIEIATETVINAPLTNTSFVITGDQIGEYFNIEESKESSVYTAVRTEAHIVAEQTNNETGETSSELGGSVPINASFKGIANEPTTYYYTWFIYNKKDMNNAIVRYTDKNISYTFKETGDYRVLLEVADQSSTCVDSVSVDLSTSKSSLEVPNFLLLDGTREFKVSYKSIIQFKCTIFNRWGNKIYEFTDPSKGWDGKYKGKEVNPGVYFYMIAAVGGDGKNYKKAGDINVLKKK